MASGAIGEMVRWRATSGVWFDLKKAEVMYFSCSKLGTAPALRYGDSQKYPVPALYWLGIWLDSRLSLRIYVALLMSVDTLCNSLVQSLI